MAAVTRVGQLGSQLVVTFDDGSDLTLFQAGSMWIPGRNAIPSDPTPADNGGDGVAADDDTDPDPTSTDPGEPDPVKPSTGIDLYNPWKSLTITGTWQDHMSYSQGGIDYPLGYGTPIKAPAAGTLHVTGGGGEYAAGQVGSAGRRSILYLDKSFTRKKPRQQREGSGKLVAIVFQHQSRFGKAKHYNRGEIIGYSGASANGSDYGGDIHLHVHGLNSSGVRLNLLNFIP